MTNFVTDVAELYIKQFPEETLDQNTTSEDYIRDKRQNAVVLGLNRIGLSAFKRLNRYKSPHLNLLGFIDVYNKQKVDSSKWGGIKYLGEIHNFKYLLNTYQISKIYIAVDNRDLKLIHTIVNLCKRYSIQYEFVAEASDVIYGNTIQQVLGDLNRPWEFSFRQVFDSFSAFILLIFVLPLWSIVSLMIKFDSSGPVIFSQERVGKKGRIFRVFKFRTMYTDAEKLSGPVLASKHDPRVTKVGRILRNTRIDEIPQLLNVLIGDMSFIGPRPERPYFVDKYSMEFPLYKTRLKIKPGITGLAQVTTGYDESLEDVKEKLKYDLMYIDKNSSMSMNLKVMIKTLWVIVTGKGQ